MSAQRITSMSRARFQELRKQLIDGVLSEKWKDKTPTTKADKVEDGQIRAMDLIFQMPKDERLILDTDNWNELHVVRDCDTLKLEIIGSYRTVTA